MSLTHKSRVKRRHVVLLVAILMLFICALPASAGDGNTAVFTVGKNTYVLNGNTVVMDAAPYIKDGRTFLPLRFAAKAVGTADENIIYDPALKTVTIIKGDRVVQLTVGNKALLLNGTVVMMDVAPEVVNGRIMLPISWLAQALSVSIEWDPVSRTVTVKDVNETDVNETNGAYKSIVKEYRWRDKQGNEWTWQIHIPEDMYMYYRSQLRIHERILKEYLERLNELKYQLEELKRYMDFWYQQCRILPGDSYYQAWRKYQTYMNAYYEAQRKLLQIQSEYVKLQQLFQRAEYRQMLDGYVPYVTEEKNYELVRDSRSNC
ncbi:copper amine oxidase N-terminal domain-containing protein [Thermacetogenium phaeum]|uniref:copper amine oxidase N-terminal domain-containing protein n=1 Tax=Thermacetogenium phaeum TaxID=85874 RepID=UPI0002EB0225|nr:copper amine oxidase N-terminal domain-containing protein [Thermacetogenium phaeum]